MSKGTLILVDPEISKPLRPRPRGHGSANGRVTRAALARKRNPIARAKRLLGRWTIATCPPESKMLGDNQALANLQIFRIVDAFLVRIENLFPARRGFVKFSRDRGERIA